METPTTTQACLLVEGVPKQLSRRKLQRILGRHIGNDGAHLWRIDRVVPLEQIQLLHVICDTEEVSQRFLYSTTMPWHISTLPPCIADSSTLSVVVDTQPSLLQLNIDCLQHIIKLSRLKDQLVWTKVSQLCLELVIDCWRRRFTTLFFDLHQLEFHYELDVDEISDFCALIGPHVRRLIFNSIFYFPLLQRHLRDRPGNLMQNAKRFINMRLCQQLCHFSQLEIFEVQGKFLADFTLRELSRHCPQLRVCRLLDAGTRWLVGKHLQHFTQLQQLEFKDCESLGRRALRRACAANTALHTLHVVECLELYRSSYFEQHLCICLSQLRQLHMTAIANGRMLQAILDLPVLTELRFYWLNDFSYFENMLFALIQQHERSVRHLCALEFHNERIYVDNESQEQLSPAKYARMRETVSILSRPWNWQCNGRFERFMGTMCKLEALNALDCNYCRPFDAAQLLQLASQCTKLHVIKLLGCRDVTDAEMQRQFSETAPHCQLRLVDGVSLTALQTLRHELLKDRHRPNIDATPAMRSIVCRFN